MIIENEGSYIMCIMPIFSTLSFTLFDSARKLDVHEITFFGGA